MYNRIKKISLLIKLLILFIYINCICVAAYAQTTMENTTKPTKPKVIFFDVNETLLDLQSMRSSVSKVLMGRNDLLPLWFSTMLHHSLVDTTTQRFHTFGQIGVSSLMMVAQINDIPLTEQKAREAIVTPLRSLPAHSDVKAGLQTLKNKGYTLVSLTNSSNLGVKTQFNNAGLMPYFDHRLSVEDIKIYKPDLRAYKWALKQMNIKPQEALMVAAHGWDIAGAKASGMQAAFISRPTKVLYPLGIKPDYIVKDLFELNKLL